jgi:hypothetical protein
MEVEIQRIYQEVVVEPQTAPSDQLGTHITVKREGSPVLHDRYHKI